MKMLLGFAETSRFTRKIVKLLSDDDFAEIQQFISENPDFGKIIQGSGGIRKIRCGVDNRGKSSGARIIYYYAVSRDKILLLDVYAKNEKENLSLNEIKILRREVEELIK